LKLVRDLKLTWKNISPNTYYGVMFGYKIDRHTPFTSQYFEIFF